MHRVTIGMRVCGIQLARYGAAGGLSTGCFADVRVQHRDQIGVVGLAQQLGTDGPIREVDVASLNQRNSQLCLPDAPDGTSERAQQTARTLKALDLSQFLGEKLNEGGVKGIVCHEAVMELRVVRTGREVRARLSIGLDESGCDLVGCPLVNGDE